MSTKQFDPSRITIADIFRAKEERRRRLAKLPYEEKIKIVERLKTVPARIMANEKPIFEAFLKVYPDFAGEPIKEWDVVNEWYSKRSIPRLPQPFDERPDVIAVTSSGKRIGIELKSWVNREQITEARKKKESATIFCRQSENSRQTKQSTLATCGSLQEKMCDSIPPKLSVFDISY